MIFSSEPLQGENVWFKLEPGQMMEVDHQMSLRSLNVAVPFELSDKKEELPINYEI
jgi:hypothetical protein